MAKLKGSNRLKLATTTDKPGKTFRVPPRPPSIPESMQGEYRSLVRHLNDAGVWSPQKMGIVETYLTHLHLMRRASAELDRDGFTLDGKPHPANSALAKAGPIVLRAGTALGLVGDTRGGMRPQPDEGDKSTDKNPWSRPR
jgi:phage terminase small subunit